MPHTYEEKRYWLILQCRYYNGEEKQPDTFDNAEGLYWYYEQCWVNFNLKGEDDKKYLDEGAQYMKPIARIEDKTPLTLQGVLLNRYIHWGGGWKPIEEEAVDFLNSNFYTKYLKRQTNKERRTVKRTMELLKKCRIYKGEATNPYDQMHDYNRYNFWRWEKEWMEALADSYTNRERFFNELMLTPVLGSCPLSGWKQKAKMMGMPATLLACMGARYPKAYPPSFWHELEDYFDEFLDIYIK